MASEGVATVGYGDTAPKSITAKITAVLEIWGQLVVWKT